MKYKGDFSSIPVTGAAVDVTISTGFLAWRPSTWPAAPDRWDPWLVDVLRKIFRESMLDEISGVINDATSANGSLEHRGHVVAIAMLCALEAISVYGYGRTAKQQAAKARGRRRSKASSSMAKFVSQHFPSGYPPYADDVYELYRNSLVHNWNLFEVSLRPDKEPIAKHNGALGFGLLHFFDALEHGTEDFLRKLTEDRVLQFNALDRYRRLKDRAVP